MCVKRLPQLWLAAANNPYPGAVRLSGNERGACQRFQCPGIYATYDSCPVKPEFRSEGELLRLGADVNARSEQGLTPLMYAAGFDQFPEVVRMLL